MQRKKSGGNENDKKSPVRKNHHLVMLVIKINDAKKPA
jgi:hypothetical protein